MRFFKNDLIFKFYVFGVYVLYIWLCLSINKLSGDIEENPDPKCNCSIYHWTLGSMTAHNYLKTSLLRAYISLHNVDVVSISETYRDSNTENDGRILESAKFDLLRADHACYSKRGGVCIY